MTWKTAGSMLLVGVLASACSEKPQVSDTRKADRAPYATAAGGYTAGSWKEGDAAAWERHLNSRAQSGQNEYNRVNAR